MNTSLWLNVDPLKEKYPSIAPYTYCLNNPIKIIDADGADIIVLGNSAGAKGAGHQAVLIGNDKKGWCYISKEGAKQIGGAFGKSRYAVKIYKTLDEFKNSVDNFEVASGTNHSKTGGGPEDKAVFALDKKGNKIQRYDQAYFIDTNESKDNDAIIGSLRIAQQDYSLTTSDCSYIPTKALNILEDIKGKKLKNGESTGITSDLPKIKQENIEKRNKGVDYDAKIKPTSNKLQNGEKGKKED